MFYVRLVIPRHDKNARLLALRRRKVYREGSQKRGNNQLAGSCVEKNALVVSRVRGQNGQTGRRPYKAAATQITT